MKYIRGQDGGIYSVSRLKPPCRESKGGEPIWRMSVVTSSGENCTYASYSTEALAIEAYKIMEAFMTSRSVMIKFGLRVDSLPNMAALAAEAIERVLNQLDDAIDGEEKTDDNTD